MKTAFEIRQEFLNYFEHKQHTVVESSSLIPYNDPTLLFTNAGMVQFKGVFLGEEQREYRRATSSQKCVRAGGKHNDLENVGRTARHHTFFEMLGNFSFGDYFKEEAITMAWELLTQILTLPKEKLWVSVFREDDEAARIWQDRIGVDSQRIVAMGEKDNFWAMGDTGPCGPCSEIIIDQGEAFGCAKPDCMVGCECDRFLELWNLVFMQYNRDQHGTKTPLPKPSIDTGMGLERIAAVVQQVQSNYDSDLFTPLIRFVENSAQKAYGAQAEQDISMRIIADHSRAIAFLIGDGVLPSNEGRGYVLRRIMRRAARHGKKLGLVKPFLHHTAQVVAEEMKAVFPELIRSQEYICRVILNEEETFSTTLEAGLKILQDEIQSLQQKKSNIISGDVAFKLYDTYGFPLDLTQDIAAEYAMRLDENGFQKAMGEQRKRAREAWKGSGEEQIAAIYKQLVQDGIKTVFTGYHTTEDRSQVKAIICKGEIIKQASKGDAVEIVTASTCLYGESGGQVGDSGTICSTYGTVAIHDTLKPFPELFIHRGTVSEGTIAQNEEVSVTVDTEKRQATANNHTATHILHAVLRQVLGNHVKQAGSLVSPERLRFDFTHFAALTRDELEKIEELANERIRENSPLDVQVVALSEAMEKGATALFGEKYGEEVRVVSIAGYSMELCGGTHNHSTGEIGILKIISEAGIAAGVRRIEALTGKEALRYIKRQDALMHDLSQALKADREEILAKIERLLAEQKELEKEVHTLKAQLIAKESGNILDAVREIGGIKVLVTKVTEGDVKSLREYGDQLKNRLGSGVIVIGSDGGGAAQLLSMVSKDVAKQYPAKKIIERIAPIIEGRGGGKDEMAQAGGKKPEKIGEALQQAWSFIEEMVKSG